MTPQIFEPGSVIGVLGGGQLGAMFAGAALGTAGGGGIASAITAMAGMSALPAGIRRVLLEQYRNGKIQSAERFWQVHRSTIVNLDHVASTLNVKREDVLEMETRLSGGDVALEPQTDEEGESYAPIAYLADTDAEPGRVLEHEQEESKRSQGLSTALATLDARSRRIIETRWLREKDQATLHDLAAEFGVSRTYTDFNDLLADPEIDAVISTGGTGLTGRDVTPEAFRSVFEKEIDGIALSAIG